MSFLVKLFSCFKKRTVDEVLAVFHKIVGELLEVEEHYRNLGHEAEAEAKRLLTVSEEAHDHADRAFTIAGKIKQVLGMDA